MLFQRASCFIRGPKPRLVEVPRVVGLSGRHKLSRVVG